VTLRAAIGATALAGGWSTALDERARRPELSASVPGRALARQLLGGGQVKRMNFNRFRQLARDQRGATMVEYIVIVALILLVALQAWKSLGTNVNAKTEKAAEALQ
jgi:Flp pilus assembly pilin Flp